MSVSMRDAAGITVRYDLIPVGADQESIDRLMAAIRVTLDSYSSTKTLSQSVTSADEANRSIGVHRVLVPIPGDADPAVVSEKLSRRIRYPLPLNVDVILQTSGSTTGEGHLVGLSASALCASAKATLEHLGGAGRWVLALPLHHVAGFQMLVRSIVGGFAPITALSSDRFNPAQLAAAIDSAIDSAAKLPNTSGYLPPVYVSLVPTQLIRMLDDPDPMPLKKLAQAAKVLIGGAGLDPLVRARAQHHGINIVTTYGMTETCGGCVYDGVPLLGTKVAVVDGRVWLSGTSLMEGYLDDLEATEIVFRSGRRWWKTADTGYFDGTRLVVTGRTDDVINTGGIKVSATEVARSIKTLPYVAQACVIGLPDEYWGSIAAAAVVLREEPAVDEVTYAAAAVAIREHVCSDLGRKHGPRVVVFMDEFPIIGIGKIDRRVLKTQIKAAVAQGKAWIHQ